MRGVAQLNAQWIEFYQWAIDQLPNQLSSQSVWLARQLDSWFVTFDRMIVRYEELFFLHRSRKFCTVTGREYSSESDLVLTYFPSRDVYQTYVIRLPNGGLLIDSHLSSSVTGQLHGAKLLNLHP
jgi:hypothetical protein